MATKFAFILLIVACVRARELEKTMADDIPGLCENLHQEYLIRCLTPRPVRILTEKLFKAENRNDFLEAEYYMCKLKPIVLPCRQNLSSIEELQTDGKCAFMEQVDEIMENLSCNDGSLIHPSFTVCGLFLTSFKVLVL